MFRLAGIDELEAGMNWYRVASDHANRLAVQHGEGLSAEQFAGIIAAFSPQRSWNENLRMAESVANRRMPGCMQNEYGKVVRMLENEPPLNILGGNKVRSFYNAIVGDDDSVCVDTHALKIALGREPEPREIAKHFRHAPSYARAADCYRAASDTVGISPRELQAVTWITYRARMSKNRQANRRELLAHLQPCLDFGV
jgi:hypothetical protein